MKAKMKDKSIIISTKSPNNENETYSDNWYVTLPNAYYKNIFGNTIKKTGYLPWKRRVVKIYSAETNKSVYRIFKGSSYSSTKVEDDVSKIWISLEAAYVLTKKVSGKTPVTLSFTKGNKFSFYWNHFDHNIRNGYKLGMVALIISAISLLITFGQLFI